MDPTMHIPVVTLFHYLIHAMTLTKDEQEHLKSCSHCQSVLDDFDTYVAPGMIHAA